ncbi:MAG: pseudouridine synthase [Myxococcales bacterium]|nr:pseudouridine synthase [Myxococcales bacterium]
MTRPPKNPKPAPAGEDDAADAAPLPGERLQKVIARTGRASRRAVEELIREGRVEVNGKTVTDMGRRVNLVDDIVRVDGERVRLPNRRVVVLLNKPTGCLCAASDPEKRRLVYAYVPKGEGLRTIGRLDYNTEGVLLLTNDGDLAERLGHARYSVQRIYDARVRGVPTAETIATIVRGVRLEDGPARAERAEVVKATDNNAWVRLELTEGRNREVRRLMERVGHPVVRLRRVAFAGLTAAGLKVGQWRTLDDGEVEQLAARGHVGSFTLPPDPRRKAPSRPVRTLPAPGRPEKPGHVKARSPRPTGTAPPRERPARGASRPAKGASRPAKGASRPAKGASRPAQGASRPAKGASRPAQGSSRPSGGPSRPARGGSRSGPGPSPRGGRR